MKTIYLTLTMLLLSCFGFSQIETFNGKITDDFGQALERAWVLVLDADDLNYVTGTVTDENGNFEIPDIKKGNYVLSVDHISFEEPKMLGILNTEDKVRGLDNMHLKQVGTDLILASALAHSSMHLDVEVTQK